MKTKLLLLAAIAVTALSSCIKDDSTTITHNYSDEEYEALSATLNLPVDVDDYTLDLPSALGGFPVSVNDRQATLGRVLFYDKRLTGKDISCASCHKAEKAFTDGDQFSQGVKVGERTSRNTLALGSFPSFNAYYGFGGTRMFWDNRAASVMDQSAETMKNPVEMGIADIQQLANDLLKERYYQILFDKAFPNTTGLTNEEKMLTAIQAFVSSIGCFNSEFDKAWVESGSNSAEAADFTSLSKHKFTAQQNEGKALFYANCASCHNLGAGFSTVITSANNGLDMNYQDEGIYKVSGLPSDKGLFKVPMLRNVELTAPYMHDGRFATLEDVVEHYSSGIKNHPNLHENLKENGEAKQMNFTSEEKQALVAFLKTLTDRESLASSRYADPFK